MGRVLFHICGPFALYSYGAAIAIGALLFIWFMQRDKRFTALGLETTFNDIFLIGLLGAIVGGRFLHVIGSSETFEHWTYMLAFWQPGFSILGSVLGVLCTVPFYLKRHHIPIAQFLDLATTYAGLLQGVSRLGCFFAGCCFGCQTTIPWAVHYTDADSMAPLNVYMHPTQLYSAGILLSIFLFMYFVGRHIFRIPGQQASIYLMLVGIERFVVDFWRGDREYIPHTTITTISLHQAIALALVASAGIYCMWITFYKKRTH